MGCGGRSGLDPEPQQHLTVTMVCPESPQLAAIDHPLTLTAGVEPVEELRSGLWSIAEGTMLEVEQTSFTDASVRSKAPAAFTMTYEARFSDGTAHACQTDVEIVEGLSARCPDSPIVALIGQPELVVGRVFDAIGVEEAQWRLLGETGDWISLTQNAVKDGRVEAELLATSTGMARLELTAVNERGETDSCTVDILVPDGLGASCAPEVRTGANEPVELQVRLAEGGPFEAHTIRVGSADDLLPAARWENFKLGDTLATVEFTPLSAGVFEVEHQLNDPYGQTATCSTLVIAEPGAPTVQCPPLIETEPLQRVAINARVSDDEGTPTILWELISRPPGSDAKPPFPIDSQETGFRPDLAGSYVLRLTAIDAGGLAGICETQVLAVATEGLRVEMFWDTDGTDMDLHVLSPAADAWFTNLDCHFANCTSGLSWGEATDDDDPHLDIDDTNGFGPENINIDVPELAAYEIGVHAFQGRSLQNAVTVRIYCGGSKTEPKVSIGPVTLRGSTSPFNNDFWKVATVEVQEDGGCEITHQQLEGGGAVIVTGTAAGLIR